MASGVLNDINTNKTKYPLAKKNADRNGVILYVLDPAFAEGTMQRIRDLTECNGGTTSTHTHLFKMWQRCWCGVRPTVWSNSWQLWATRCTRNWRLHHGDPSRKLAMDIVEALFCTLGHCDWSSRKRVAHERVHQPSAWGPTAVAALAAIPIPVRVQCGKECAVGPNQHCVSWKECGHAATPKVESTPNKRTAPFSSNGLWSSVAKIVKL